MDRIVVARAKFREAQAQVYSPATETPCIKCRFYEFACRHPSVAEVTANPETGSVKLKAVDALKARSETGVCGPEGALFTPRSEPALLLIEMLSTPSGRWAAAIGIFVICCLLFA